MLTSQEKKKVIASIIGQMLDSDQSNLLEHWSEECPFEPVRTPVTKPVTKSQCGWAALVQAH